MSSTVSSGHWPCSGWQKNCRTGVCIYVCAFICSWVWCGVGVVWCGVAWRGVAWRGVAWRGVAWRGVVWCTSKVCVYLSIHSALSLSSLLVILAHLPSHLLPTLHSTPLLSHPLPSPPLPSPPQRASPLPHEYMHTPHCFTPISPSTLPLLFSLLWLQRVSKSTF